MKIKYSSIIKFNITLLLLMQLSYTKLLGNLIPIFSTSYISNPLVIFYLSMGIITILLSEVYSYLNGRMLYLEMLIMAAVIIGALYNTSEKYSTIEILYVIAFGFNYMYFFLAIPISNGIAIRSNSMMQITILPDIPTSLLSIFVFLIPRNIQVNIRLQNIVIRNESRKFSILICSPQEAIPVS